MDIRMLGDSTSDRKKVKKKDILHQGFLELSCFYKYKTCWKLKCSSSSKISIKILK